MRQESSGQLIRRMRLEAKLSQRDIAKAARVSQQLVSKWERGTVAVGNHAAVVASALGIAPEELQRAPARLGLIHGGGNMTLAASPQRPTPATGRGIEEGSREERFWNVLEGRSTSGPFTDAEVAFFRDLAEASGVEL